jgi:hypothetical protein
MCVATFPVVTASGNDNSLLEKQRSLQEQAMNFDDLTTDATNAL